MKRVAVRPAVLLDPGPFSSPAWNLTFRPWDRPDLLPALEDVVRPYWSPFGVPVRPYAGELPAPGVVRVHLVDVDGPAPFVAADPVIGAALVENPESGTTWSLGTYTDAVVLCRPNRTPTGYVLNVMARVISHEAGHAYGLQHTNETDIAHSERWSLMHAGGPGYVWTPRQQVLLADHVADGFEAAVRAAYHRYLGREAAVSEVLGWAAAELTGMEAVRAIGLSEESLTRLCRRLLRRDPEPGLVPFWQGCGLTVEVIAANVVRGSEFWGALP
jgi:hypothetical protein